ncbi:hypothetical protein CYLTODRAFT_425347 [Cylindrobasidium torrendii FP15055 ss-10]|uniref:Uncharacterized protein n=1 Tax=Cylindrobasidium torrendii FP15055 ss-10 TaxID=1314674 RepID=A0A0D7B109_9AGAR|nr:hypothetical protein CYLTODRAFT_425347 [Cylindrobasidium torrendii FP15055 ss-10]
MAHFASALNIRQELFTTNQPPSEEELKVVDAKLARLREEHALLTLRLAEMERMSPYLVSIRHPMRILPDDILTLIFEYATPWCFADGVGEDSFPSPDPMGSGLGPPWTLSHVCKNWRAICLSRPHLWSTLRIANAAGVYRSAQKIDTIFQRSEPLPLRLYITEMVPPTILPLVLGTAFRWRCLYADPAHVGLSGKNNHFFPSLTHLALDLSESPTMSAAYIVAPCLHSLDLHDGFSTSASLLRLPWEQIKRYKAVNTTSFEILLQGMRNLEELIINEDAKEEEELYTGTVLRPRISLAKLRYLEYESEFGSDSLTRLVNQCVNMESLRTLVIVNRSREYHVVPLERSLPSVLELSLSFGDADGVREFLGAAPNVQSLHFEFNGSEVEDLESMLLCPTTTTERPTAAGLRQLKHLSFTLHPSSKFL